MQVVHELQVQEEVEGVRQEVREVKGGESKVEESRSLHEHMDDKHKTHDLSHGECARCHDVQTNEKKQDKAHSHSGVRVLSMWKSVKMVTPPWCPHRAMLPRNHGPF